jgi:hypothetical protein
MEVRHLDDAGAGGLEEAPKVRVSDVHKLGAELDGAAPAGGPGREDAASEAFPGLDQHDLFSPCHKVTRGGKPGDSAAYHDNLHRFLL